MRKTCNVYCKFLDDFDLFGKEVELYYKGKAKRATRIGLSFTLIYIGMYFAFFIYKVIRMIKKVDVTFYESKAFTGEPPNIKLSKEKFYGGFALGNPLSLKTFVDDTIYNVEAYYIRGRKEGNEWNWEKKPLELEICQLDRFGEDYRDIFREKSINQLHCVKDLDHVLEGHLTYDVYSYYLVKFFPCINGKRNKNNCQDISIVQQYLTQTFVTFKMEDVDLTPQLYNSPVSLRGKEVSANVGSSLFKDVHSFFQIINIETDEDILGFEGLSEIKKEKYIKYDQSIILSSLKDDIFVSGDSICDVTIALSEQELTQKRTYPKLIEVIGDVGGFMEVFFSLFRIISSFLTDTLYETSLVNHLFSFDLENKKLLIKDKNKSKGNTFNDPKKIYSPNALSGKFSIQNSFNNDEMNIYSNNKLNEDILIKNKMNNDITLLSKPKKKKKNKRKIKKTSYSINGANIWSNELKDNTNIFVEKEGKENNNCDNNSKIMDNKDEKEKEMETRKKNENEKVKNGIINKIKMNKLCTYFCFLCVRKTKNMENILIDEGMKIITEKLDVMNLFKKIVKDEIIQERENIKNDLIEMSDECKAKLYSINNKAL